MVVKSYDADTFHRYNNKNWLGSEVGFVSKSISVDEKSATPVVEDGRKILKSGSIITAPLGGLLLCDIDVTDGAQEAPLLYGGYYIDANLPASASAQAANFQKHGLFAVAEGAFTRPNFGTIGALPVVGTVQTPTAETANVTWTAVNNAIEYRVFYCATADGNYVQVATVATPSYTALQTGYFKVQAVGDNLNYSDSALSASVNVSALV